MRINPATAHKNEVNALNEVTLFEIHETFYLSNAHNNSNVG